MLTVPMLDAHAVDWSETLDVNFQSTYGEWIRLFRGTGYVVEELIETQLPQGATST